MYKQVLNKNDLMSIGYSEYTSKQIIKKARLYMVELGSSYYESRKITTIPAVAISEILGFEIEIKEE